MWSKIRIFLEMIKFEHTIFALPFAYLGAFLASRGVPSLGAMLWITLAMVGARTAAMALNRLIDRKIDAKNPRTADRAMAKGIVSVGESLVYIVVSFGLLFWATLHLNPLTTKLMPIAVFFLVLYSYTKRFTWLCHIVLGISLGLAPMGSWIAITGYFEPATWMLGVAVTLWVAGFDILYACQDEEFDRQVGLFSIPSRFGRKLAIRISALFHALAPGLLLLVGQAVGLGMWYYLGVLVAMGLLVYEHSLVKPHDLSKLDAAFFSMNGYLSVAMFSFTLLDILLAK